MIDTKKIGDELKNLGFTFYSGVPCSFLKDLINYAINECEYVMAANEGDAVAISSGASLGGKKSVVLMQNSGLTNATSPLTSLNFTFQLPVLGFVSLRGEPGLSDEPQHELMGRITTDMLDLMQIRWEYFPVDDAAVGDALARAAAHMESNQLPYALVMRKDSVARAPLQTKPVAHQPGSWQGQLATMSASRRDVLLAIQAVVPHDAVIVATTGYTGRELYACADRPNQIYMVGSMGCAVSFGLGIALAQPQRPVIVLDGDGAALMRLGAQSIVGYEQPKNLCHVLLDNGIHESTGGQATVARSVNFCAIAAANGYVQVHSVAEPAQIAAAVRKSVSECAGPAFIHAPILPGVPDDLPRPVITPAEVAARLRAFLRT